VQTLSITASKSNQLMLKVFAEHFRALKLLPKKMFVKPSLGTKEKEGGIVFIIISSS
jgi:hypothetical protein